MNKITVPSLERRSREAKNLELGYYDKGLHFYVSTFQNKINDKEMMIHLDQVPDILVNDSEVRQLILNLVRNALEETPVGGTVLIHTYCKEEYVVLSITDQGNGIPKEIQEKMGTPFITTKENGTGLGLAISIGITQRHNAKFDYDTPDQGTTFYIMFPRINTKK